LTSISNSDEIALLLIEQLLVVTLSKGQCAMSGHFRLPIKLSLALSFVLLVPVGSGAQNVANFRADLSAEASVQAGAEPPQNKTVSGDVSLNLSLGGGEVDACVRGDGRTSAAQASGERKILEQSDDRLVIQLSSRSYARGGHIRNCDACIARKCVGIHGEDTGSHATATSAANIDVKVNTPLKRFKYDLYVGHSDTEGALSVSVTTPDGTQIAAIPNQPSHFLMSEATREIIVHVAANTDAIDRGGCCDKTDSKNGVLTVSLTPAAELDANYVFQPFIAGGKPTTGYTNVVALGLNNRITCSGTYVGFHTVVTAAHCVFPVKESFKKNKLDVRFGSRFDMPDQTFSVASVEIPHDPSTGFSFNPETFEDDIALVTFAGDAVAKPAVLYAGDPAWASVVDQKLPVEIVGFGFNVIDGGQEGLGFKREAPINIERFDNRRLFFGSQTANTCNGDSGGPLFVETPDGQSLLLAGVTSGGDDKCTYGVDTRLDAFAGWIKPFLK
jgi:secreted trypsin-like serine protease